jgi:hypothetical protein
VLRRQIDCLLGQELRDPNSVERCPVSPLAMTDLPSVNLKPNVSCRALLRRGWFMDFGRGLVRLLGLWSGRLRLSHGSIGSRPGIWGHRLRRPIRASR